MPSAITTAEYRALAELRYRIRKFLQEGDVSAHAAGLQRQQYLMLLAIRGLPEDITCTIRVLAERLALKHHSAVELIDRLEERGCVKRVRSQQDRREVRVMLLSKGERLLEEVVRQRISELRSSGAALAQAIGALVRGERSNAAHRKRP